MPITQGEESGRLDEIKSWLTRDGAPAQVLADTIQRASSDAGQRSYYRVATADGGTLVVMDAGRIKSCMAPFIRMAAVIIRAGARAPAILDVEREKGLMLMEDLGRDTYLDRLRADPSLAPAYFDAATTALVAIQSVSAPGIVPEYSEGKIREELSLFPDWYVARQKGTELSVAEKKIWNKVCDALVESMLSEERVIVHRDYMPRNLMASDPLPGIIDFQDALYGPVSYDIASLMRDAFISWDESFTIDVSVRYWEKARAALVPVPEDFGAFWQGIEWTGLQRHLKVLGIFSRLKHRDGKPKYIEDAARFVSYVRHTAARYERLRPLLAIMDRIEGTAGRDLWTY